MDWKVVIGRLDKDRLQRACAEVGIEAARLKKAELQQELLGRLDLTVKQRVLGALTLPELRQLARALSITLSGTRKDEIVESFLEEEELAAIEQEMAANPPPADAHRPDVFAYVPVHPEFELVPTQPVGDEEALFDELSEQLARRTLKRMVFVSYVCNPRALERLAGPGIDDLTEALCRAMNDPDNPRQEPMLTLVLDREQHGLGTTEAGRRLVALALELGDEFFEIRLGPVDRRLHAKVYMFEESLDGGPWLTGYVGSSNLTAPGIGVPGSSANIEANIRVAGWLGPEETPATHLHRWVHDLLAESYPLTPQELERLPVEESVRRKVQYKRDFDTAHEIRLKHLAELITRRGRYSWPLCDVSALSEPPEHQLAPVARSAEAGTSAFLLLDEVGLGKTVEAGLILSRELRRRRWRHDAAPRRALVLAPPAIHEQWKEELETKFNLPAEVFASGTTKRIEKEYGLERGAAWDAVDARIVITSPDMVRHHIDDAQGFEIILVDEFHRARGPATHDALAMLRDTSHLRILSSGTPVQNRLSELRTTFDLTYPAFSLPGEKAFDELFAGPDGAAALRRVLVPFATRAFRRHLIGTGPGQIPPRRVENLQYRLSTSEGETYLELRELRREYATRRRSRAGWAFLMMEQMFLSSPHAFLQLASHIAGDVWAPPELDPELKATLTTRDDSYQFLRGSAHYQRRLRMLGAQLREEANDPQHLSAKEQVFLRTLENAGGERVLVFTRFRATQQRLAAVVSRYAADVPVRQLNGSTPRRERARYLAWFTDNTRPTQSGRPAGVLICTDVAAEGLNLQQGCSVLINYDLPWNPQRIEQRIGRLQRWGQSQEVRVFNLQASNPLASDGWTMDTRVVEVCRNKFGLAEQTVGASEALLGVQPVSIDEAFLADDIDQLLGDVPIRQTEELDQLFPGELGAAHRDAIARARSSFHEYRELVRTFWERVTNRSASLAYAHTAFYGRLQNALLQGQVGVLRAAGTPLAQCQSMSLLAGVRVIVEAAELEEPDDDVEDVHPDLWLIEDEMVRVWGVREGQAPFDASGWLLDGGTVEVLPYETIGVVDPETLEFLLVYKNRVQVAHADGAPLDVVIEGCSASLQAALRQVRDAAEVLALTRTEELRDEWDQHGERWNALVGSLVERAEDCGLRKVAIRELGDARIPDGATHVRFRHEVRLTQLLLVLE